MGVWFFHFRLLLLWAIGPTIWAALPKPASAATPLLEGAGGDAASALAVPLGERVRLATAGSRLVGTLAALDEEALTLVLDDGLPRRLPLSEVKGLEASLGRPNPVARAGYGAALGFVAATLLSAAIVDESEFDSGYGVDLLAGALFGLPIGAVTGFATAPRERWRPVEWGSATDPSRKGSALGIQIWFAF